MHADNPVAWYPWGEEAFQRAREEDKPIFLSIGYSSCHWCHVMARECFENPEIAEILNREFVCIKVDREQRPDVDEVYLTAVELMTGQAGWPLSVFLTPDGAAFFGGTYFPPEDSEHGVGFRTVLNRVAEAWRTRRSDVERTAKAVMRAVRAHLSGPPGLGFVPRGGSPVKATLAGLRKEFDPVYGGFGWSATTDEMPKFPQAPRLLLLAELADRDDQARHMLVLTLRQLMRGGIYDHVGGGIHRYSTDRRWLVPHFEKMLYDNGLFLLVLAESSPFLQEEMPVGRVVEDTVAFLKKELRSPTGAFFSSLGADSDGREGAYYLWRREELQAILDEQEFQVVERVFGLDGPPQLAGAYVLHRARTERQVARETGRSEDAIRVTVESALAKLAEARAARMPPPRDEKIIAGWNGLAIAGLAAVGQVFGDAEALRLAEEAADGVQAHLWSQERGLYRTRRPYGDDVPATLNDYAFLAWGLLRLADASGEARWLALARNLVDHALVRFWDETQRRFWLVDEEHDPLLPVRPVSFGDGALPAGSSVLAECLVELARRTGESGYAVMAEKTLNASMPALMVVPEAQPLLVRAWARFQELRSSDNRTPPDNMVRPVTCHVACERVQRSDAAADGRDIFRVRLTLVVADGWYVYAPEASSEHGVPASARVRLDDGLKLIELRLPRGELMTLPGYEGQDVETAVWRGRQTLEFLIERVDRSGRDSGGQIVLICQPCTVGRCALPGRFNVQLKLQDNGELEAKLQSSAGDNQTTGGGDSLRGSGARDSSG